MYIVNLMINSNNKIFAPFWVMIATAFFMIAGAIIVMASISHADDGRSDADGRLITIHDRGDEKVILTNATTIGDALKEAGVKLDSKDTVEPSVDQKLIASDYQVNIYRARPVIVVDGAIKQKIITPYQTTNQIAKDAGIDVYPEDIMTLDRTDDILADGAGLKLTIDRATPFKFILYGKSLTARTQAKTVGEMLAEKGITLAENDRVSVDKSTPITSDLSVRVWREGKQTITVEEDVDFEVEEIADADQPVGYRSVRTAGELGSRSVTYEVKIQDGKEVSRTEIASITTKESKKQVEIIGVKSSGKPLTKSMGVNMFTDSKGVTHRETYYDLPMSGVMGFCGGGVYTIRSDGAKIDKNGYVIVAAHLGNYPRCSIVETSLGAGKVYDTGGFAIVHPYGFDLATDWSKNDGI